MRTPPPATPRTSRDLLRDRTFGPWFWGNLASNTGTWLFNVTAAIVVFELTRSALLVGLVSVAQFLPLVVLSPWAGALADRLDRRTFLLAGQTVAAIAATGIAAPTVMVGVEGLPGAWPLLLGALGIGVGHALSSPTLNSVVPSLVDDADLENAVSLQQLTFNVGRALGPVGAGTLIATLGPEVAFATNAVSYLVFMAAVLLIRFRPSTDLDNSDSDRSVRAGLRLARNDRTVLVLLVGMAMTAFAADPAITLTPPLAAELGGGDVLVAAMVSAFGIGATLSAMVSGRLQRAFGNARLARTGMLVMASGILGAAAAPAAWVAVAGFFLTGVGFTFAVASLTAGLHRRVPEWLRGRIMALWVIAFLGTRPIAALLNGGLADLAGVRLAAGVSCAIVLLGARMRIRPR